jgi:hypothetical protein
MRADRRQGPWNIMLAQNIIQAVLGVRIQLNVPLVHGTDLEA